MTTTELLELTRVAAILNAPPYNDPPAKLSKAVALVRDGKVQREHADRWLVAGATGEYWTVTRGVCDCPQRQYKTPWCKHAVAVELAQRIEERLKAFSASGPQEHACWPQSEPHDAFPTEEETMSTQTLPAPELPRTCAGGILPRRSIQAIVADLSKPLPPECLAQRTQGGKSITYVHWDTVAAVLDAYAPGWYGSIVRVDQIKGQIAITYRLTIPSNEGEVFQEDVGVAACVGLGHGHTRGAGTTGRAPHAV